jgi:hypothetical protein
MLRAWREASDSSISICAMFRSGEGGAPEPGVSEGRTLETPIERGPRSIGGIRVM